MIIKLEGRHLFIADNYLLTSADVLNSKFTKAMLKAGASGRGRYLALSSTFHEQAKSNLQHLQFSSLWFLFAVFYIFYA